MRDQCVTRVLIQLQRVEHSIGEQEQAQRDNLAALRAELAGLSGPLSDSNRLYEQFQLGRIEGLVSAQLELADARRMYAARARFGVPLAERTAPDREPGDPAGDAGL